MLCILRWTNEVEFSNIKSSEFVILSYESSESTEYSRGPGLTSISQHRSKVVVSHNKYRIVQVNILR